MTVIARKIQNKTLLIIQLVVGSIISIAGIIFAPIATFSSNAVMVTEPLAWCVVIGIILFFGLVGFLGFMRPYFLFKKLPDIQAQTDGKYLYLYGKKEAKIPLADMADAYIDSEVSYIQSYDFLIHLISEQYGKVIIEVPGYGTYRLHFISRARETAISLAGFVERSAREARASASTQGE